VLYGAVAVNKQDTGFVSRGSHYSKPLACKPFSDYTRASTCLWLYLRNTLGLFHTAKSRTLNLLF